MSTASDWVKSNKMWIMLVIGFLPTLADELKTLGAISQEMDDDINKVIKALITIVQ